MSITTYAELKTSIANWLNRSDLTSVIPDFITLAESYLNNALRVRQQMTRTTLSVDAEFEDVPSDFLEVSHMHITSGGFNYNLGKTSQDTLITNHGASASSRPTEFAVVGSQFQFGPTPDATYSVDLTYYAKIAALSDSNTSNWLLAAQPEIYLYSSLLQAAPFLHDDVRIRTWSTLLLEAVERLKGSDKRALINSIPSSVSIRGVEVV